MSEEAKKILELIETVDPADTAKLEEINKNVHIYLYSANPRAMIGNFNYCTSRDALKAIRPEGWKFSVGNAGGDAAAYKGSEIINTPDLPTEELAELHSVIQAIDYERNKQ